MKLQIIEFSINQKTHGKLKDENIYFTNLDDIKCFHRWIKLILLVQLNIIICAKVHLKLENELI